MAESYLFFKNRAINVSQHYQKLFSGILNETLEITEEEDGKYICNDMQFYNLSEEWCVGIDFDGDTFSEEILLQIAGNMEMIYTYFEESTLEGEFIVISNGKVIRKLLDYYFTPELNENVGFYELEKDFQIKNWVDIASFTDYLFESL